MSTSHSHSLEAAWREDRLLRLAEAARILSLSVRALQALIADGSLAVVRFGRRVAIHPDDLRAFVDARRGSKTTDFRGGRA